MKLKAWLELERGNASRLSKFLSDVDPARPVQMSFITQMAIGHGNHQGKPTPARLAWPIEQFTEGAVMRWDSCPNEWWQIWPELKDRKGSPDIPVREQAAAT